MKTPKGPEVYARRGPWRAKVGNPAQAPLFQRGKDPEEIKEKQYRSWKWVFLGE